LIPGGRGGRGNKYLATSTNRTPRVARPGLPGQEKLLRLSFKAPADIGLIGFPNTGKSTLLSSLSTARPKVASYPFTTLTPNLGVMAFDDDISLIIADTPGLIEGASKGRGLGHRFLKHIERTSLLLHLLDITYRPDNDILEDFHTVRRELAAHNAGLVQKPQMVLINKTDLHGPEHRDPEELRKALDGVGVDSLPISALTGEGIGELKKTIMEKWAWDKMWIGSREKTC
ncbi:MAG: GTPase, partial [Thermodesulfobacteriota bacterium]|nr:GTPase [Thermodesulfobacteriota bacterium]